MSLLSRKFWMSKLTSREQNHFYRRVFMKRRSRGEPNSLAGLLTFGVLTNRVMIASDPEPFMRGINSFQLFNDGQRWWILSIYWQHETESTRSQKNIYSGRPVASDVGKRTHLFRESVESYIGRLGRIAQRNVDCRDSSNAVRFVRQQSRRAVEKSAGPSQGSRRAPSRAAFRQKRSYNALTRSGASACAVASRRNRLRQCDCHNRDFKDENKRSAVGEPNRVQ